jgi:hypothetical protein
MSATDEHDSKECGGSGRVVPMALAALLLGLALQLTDGLYSAGGVAALGLSVVACAAGTLAPSRCFGVLAPAVIRALLVAAILVQLLVMPFKPAGATVTTVPMVSQRPFDAGLAMAVVAVALIGFARRRALVLIGFVLLLATFVAIGIWKIRTAPQPRIDVFVFHVEAARALLDGVNPYAITFSNIYDRSA